MRRLLPALARALSAAALAVALAIPAEASASAAATATAATAATTTAGIRGTKAKRGRARGAKAKRGRATARALRSARRADRAARPARPARRAVAAPQEPTLAALPTVDLAAALGGDLVALPSAAGVAGVAGATPAAASLPTGPAAPARPFAAFSRSAAGVVDALVERARGQLGTRYVLGGSRPGESLDCSSFARYAMEALGFRLPRTADEQARLGRPVPRDRAALKPGDLLTFGSRRRVDHVGIYLGEGRFIHASVKSGRVIETTIERNGSLFRRWLGARRLIADADTARGGDGS